MSEMFNLIKLLTAHNFQKLQLNLQFYMEKIKTKKTALKYLITMRQNLVSYSLPKIVQYFILISKI